MSISMNVMSANLLKLEKFDKTCRNLLGSTIRFIPESANKKLKKMKNFMLESVFELKIVVFCMFLS